VGLALLQGVSPTKRSAALTRVKKELLTQFKERFTLRTFLNHRLTVAYANFYREIGLDPQIILPGPQNLISRLFAEHYFPTINTLVDSCNLAVLLTLVPLGIFDQEKIKCPLTLRFSALGDTIVPIGKTTPQEIPPNIPIFMDDKTVVSIFYHRDSEFSKITLATKDVLLMTIAVEGVSTQDFEAGLNTGITFITKYNGGTCSFRAVFP